MACLSATPLDAHESGLQRKPNPKDLTQFFIVFVITLISLIIILDTFKNDFSKIIPNLNMNLKNLYESLKDIALFFKDLI